MPSDLLREALFLRIRAAETLVFSRQNSSIVAFNYLTGSTFECDPDLMGFLCRLADWRTIEEVYNLVPAIPPDELNRTVQSLLDVNALVEDGSELACREAAVTDSWHWGMPVALFHFSIQDRQPLSIEDTEALQISKLADHPQPALYMRNAVDDDGTIPLPAALPGNDLLQMMARRRTVRSAAQPSIEIHHLSECLFAGMGVTGHTRNVAGALPLAMTPSGGARNPYEAYVYARAIDGIAPGFYHYSAFDHSLARLPTADNPLPSEFLGGQVWSDDMPCVIVLCAFLERTMWKYDDANAYRVVLIEAGHIGQNMMLAATQRGLSACPTAALNHSEIQRLVGIESRATQWPIYALTLSRPGSAH